MSDSNPKLDTKLSPLIEGQVPDFIQADYPQYVQFLKSYYKFLESGELGLTLTVDSLLRETNTTSYILDETKGEKVVLETGTGSTGKFIENEIITGSTSKATATVYVEDTSNNRLFISAQQRFITGETVVGGTTGAQGIVTSYRGNPVQNIQQLLEYANPDNTIDDMLENFRRMFMSIIPSSLATGLSKRNLIKSIRDLYSAKGTSEGHKFFLRLILDDDAEIVYPEKYMLRPSSGIWSVPQVIRTTIPPNVIPSDFIGQMVTGESSGATAIIVSAVTIVEAATSFAEYELDPKSVTGTFIGDETVNVVHKTDDHLYKFTIKNIITNGSVTKSGLLHTSDEIITSDSSAGNGLATKKVDQIGVGTVDDVIIDNGGTNYRVGDSLIFNAGSQSSTAAAEGIVSVIGGIITLEDGFELLLEDTTAESLLDIGIKLEDETGALFQEDETTSTTTFGDKIYYEPSMNIVSRDRYGTLTDGIPLEVGTSGNDGSIRKVHLSSEGGGYSALPTITVTSKQGSGASLYSSTSNIGQVKDIKITNAGFGYNTAPEPIFKIHLLVKDVTGIFTKNSNVYFGLGSSGTTAGIVHNWDTATNVLSIIPSEAAPSYIKQEDGTTVSTTFGDDVLLEDGGFIIPENSFYTGETNHQISQSSGIYATIVKSSVAEGTLTKGVISSKVGKYPIDMLNTLGEDTVRIQDSYYYQQFSYEVQVGASTTEYMNALKKAVHPAGFQPFGKVSIATQIAAGISILTGKSIPDYTGDTETFTPELASTFAIVYDTLFGRRLGTTDDGTTLNSSPMDGINGNFLTDSNLGVSSGKRELTLSKELSVIVQAQPYNTSNPNALKYLNMFPWVNHQGAIRLEETTTKLGATTTFDDNTKPPSFDDDTAPPSFDYDIQTFEGVVAIDGRETDFDWTLFSITPTNVILDQDDRIILEDNSDDDRGTAPIFTRVGSIAFNEIFDYTYSGTNQPWPSTIWDHTKEKNYTLPSTVMLSSS